jgi:4a-hydroxytetrahydrobiopterin dehydratase
MVLRMSSSLAASPPAHRPLSGFVHGHRAGCDNHAVIDRFHEAAPDWRVVGQTVCTHFRTGSLGPGARLVAALGELELDDHRPAIDLRPTGVTVRLGYGPGSVEPARRVSAVAAGLGATADPAAVQNLVVTVDAMAIVDVLPFWRAVLGYPSGADAPEDELVDPHLRAPVFFFNQMDAPRPQRNRLHVDVFVPHDQAQARVTAALAAGGRLVTDQYAPAWWVLADPEGNEACVATSPG